MFLDALTWWRHASTKVPPSVRTVSTTSIYQVASTHWGAEDEKVGPAILSRLGQRAEARGDAQAELIYSTQ